MFFRRLVLTSLGTLPGIASGLVIFSLFLDRSWDNQVQIVLDTPATDIHPLTSSPSGWSRWASGGRNLTGTVSMLGPESGAGAVVQWEGGGTDCKVTIEESALNVGVGYRVEIPGQPVIHGRIRYEEIQGGTRIVWIERADPARLPLGAYFVERQRRQRARFQENALRLLAQMADAQRPG